MKPPNVDRLLRADLIATGMTEEQADVAMAFAKQLGRELRDRSQASESVAVDSPTNPSHPNDSERSQ